MDNTMIILIKWFIYGVVISVFLYTYVQISQERTIFDSPDYILNNPYYSFIDKVGLLLDAFVVTRVLGDVVFAGVISVLVLIVLDKVAGFCFSDWDNEFLSSEDDDDLNQDHEQKNR